MPAATTPPSRVLDELARFAGIRVVEFNPLYVNLPHNSPCHGGFMPAKALAEADVGLLVDVDVPWIPSDMPDNPATWWAHIDVDAEKRNFPIWTFPGNLRLPGDSHRILSDLLAVLKARADDGFKTRAAARVKELAEEGAARREQAAKAAAKPRQAGRDQPALSLRGAGQGAEPSDVVLNEAIRNGPVVLQQMPRTEPGTLVGLSGGGLGFSGGMALGLKLAMPERTVVQIVGDGTFYFSNPQSTLAVGAAVQAAGADRRARQHRLGRREGGDACASIPRARPRPADEFGATLAPDMDFSKVAEAAGAHGELVSDPDAVEAAIARCLAAVHGGRSAVLHAKVTKL